MLLLLPPLQLPPPSLCTSSIASLLLPSHSHHLLPTSPFLYFPASILLCFTRRSSTCWMGTGRSLNSWLDNINNIIFYTNSIRCRCSPWIQTCYHGDERTWGLPDSELHTHQMSSFVIIIFNEWTVTTPSCTCHMNSVFLITKFNLCVQMRNVRYARGFLSFDWSVWMGSRRSQMSMLSSLELLTIWKSSNCTQDECSCDKRSKRNHQSWPHKSNAHTWTT